MKKIIISLSVIAAVAAIVIGGTTAFFSDTEKSTGNTFTAGAIDLLIDNTSYAIDYNIPNYANPTGALVASVNTTWTLKDLTVEKFFNFTDVKPGDIGEDTISVHVNNNDAWICAELKLASNKDNSCTEPENEAEGYNANPSPTPVPNCGSGDLDWNGELAQGIEFVWWSDDGDNVLEVGEEATKYYLGPDSIKDLMGNDNKMDLTLADKYLNFFDHTNKIVNPGNVVKPLKGGQTYNIGKGWCFGEMTLVPATEGTTDPVTRGVTGFTCSGATVGNEAQSDSLTADISFTATQARNNADFRCPEHALRQD
jgi:predicted ribosomally synthesized peptide with SipW-like signal peptide